MYIMKQKQFKLAIWDCWSKSKDNIYFIVKFAYSLFQKVHLKPLKVSSLRGN